MGEVYLLIKESYCLCMQDWGVIDCDHTNTTIHGAFDGLGAAVRHLPELGGKEIEHWECVPPDDLSPYDHEVAAWEARRCAGGTQLGVRVSVRRLRLDQLLIDAFSDLDSA